MPKNIQDIVTSEKKKSIRDIPLPENRRKAMSDRRAPSERRSSTEDVRTEDVHASVAEKKDFPKLARKRSHSSGKKKWVLAGIGALLLVFVLLSIFGGATLAYTPKSADLNFAGETYTASKSGDGSLLFSVVKLSGEKGVSVPASGQEQVERKASGTIVVYNKQSSSQPLIEETRFETPDGKIYKLAVGGGIVVPAGGSVEAVVYAAEPGVAGNTGLTDFTVPGLAGTSKFENVYARSKTPMSGGFVGMAAKVSDEDLAKAKTELEVSLREELGAQAVAQVPGEFILFPTLSTVTYEELPQGDAGGSSTMVNMRGNFYGVMFKKSDLATHLAEGRATLLAGEVVEIPGLDALQVAFDGTAPENLLNAEKVTFKITGDAELVWRTNEEALRSDLAGRTKDEVPSILENFSSIAQAEAHIRPFWRGTFPDDATDISIKRLPTN